MSDQNWLDAMVEYPDSWRPDPAHWREGGSHELSSVLEREVKRDKDRFARMLLKMDEGISVTYFEAILRGLVATEEQGSNQNQPKVQLAPVNSELLNQVFRRVYKLTGDQGGRWLASAIAASAGNPLPEDILSVICGIATLSSDPEEIGNPETKFFGGDLLTRGINTARGAAADALGRLLYAKPERWPELRNAVLACVQDSAWSVRAAAMDAVTALLNIDRDLAVKLFLEHYADREALVGSMIVPSFLKFAVRTHYTQLRSFLERLLSAAVPDLQKLAASVICLASFWNEQAKVDIQWIRQGPMAVREAWANVAIHNLENESIAETNRRWLIECFRDPEKTVRRTAAGCFSRISSQQLCQEAELISQFIESLAFASDATWLLHALESAVDQLPAVVCRIAERLVELYRSDSSHDSDRMFPTQATTLVLRLYHQSKDEAVRMRCLDAIDDMLEFDVGGVEHQLAQLERS
jgi:hypothetical protein